MMYHGSLSSLALDQCWICDMKIGYFSFIYAAQSKEYGKWTKREYMETVLRIRGGGQTSYNVSKGDNLGSYVYDGKP